MNEVVKWVNKMDSSTCQEISIDSSFLSNVKGSKFFFLSALSPLPSYVVYLCM